MRVWILLMIVGCRVESPHPVDRDGIGTEIGDACRSLRAAGCPEGEPLRADRTCYEHLTDLSERTLIPTTCVRDAAGAAEVRRCGTKDTLRFRCEVKR